MTRIILSFRAEGDMVGDMSRGRFCILLALVFLLPMGSPAQDDAAPAISITSPDTGTTFAYGEIKTHSLTWNQSQKVLIAHVTFTDAALNQGASNDDTHEFRLFGISYDPAKGIFTATSAKGEVIPIAHYKKMLFIKSIETTPNAAVRVLHPKGEITVILEAISPSDPAMHPSPTDPDGTHDVDIMHLFN